jgi:phytoene dehydrogenase-like protein
MNKYDVVVIGAGISGLLSALAISEENGLHP